MRLKQSYRSALILAVALSLGACGGFREELGLNKSSPDEFRVVSRAPLTVPPDFALRPPAPGTPRPQVGTPTDQARRALTGVSPEDLSQGAGGETPDGRSAGERAILGAAGAENADPAIRQTVDRETNRINAESEDFLRSLIFWRKEDPPGLVVDPEGEARRLQENATLGRDVTVGDTPTIERKEKAILEDIF